MPPAKTRAAEGELRREHVVAHATVASMARHAVPPSTPGLIVRFHCHADGTGDGLVRSAVRADAALYRAKQVGRNGWSGVPAPRP